jgi:hypothetical protein
MWLIHKFFFDIVKNKSYLSYYSKKVHYAIGKAKIIDFTDQPNLDINSIKNCLQTKWPTIEVDWADARPPSLN